MYIYLPSYSVFLYKKEKKIQQMYSLQLLAAVTPINDFSLQILITVFDVLYAKVKP